MTQYKTTWKIQKPRKYEFQQYEYLLNVCELNDNELKVTTGQNATMHINSLEYCSKGMEKTLLQ